MSAPNPRPSAACPARLRRRLAALAVVPALALGAAACGGDDESANTTSTTTPGTESPNAPADGGGEDSAVLAEIEERGKPTVPVSPATTELVVTDDVVGTGAEVQAGDTVTVHYVGVSSTTGEEFDSSWSRGEPISFGLNQVIQGWGDGLVGMKVGGRRTLVIPPDQAYGAQSPTPAIAPNDTLTFTVDLVGIG